MLTDEENVCIQEQVFYANKWTNRIILIPNLSNSLIHPTICIMNHITVPNEEKEKQKNVANRNEHNNKKQPNIIFSNYCIIKKIAFLKNAAMPEGSQESMFSVTMTNFLLNIDLHALGVAYGNTCLV